jgi:hypothetical protein
MEGKNSKLDLAYQEMLARMQRHRQHLEAGHYDAVLMNLHLARVELYVIEGELIKKISPFPVL